MANKRQLDKLLALKTGVSELDVAKVTDALPDQLGQWLKLHGAQITDDFIGDLSGLEVYLEREEIPTSRWVLTFTPDASFLLEFGNNADRFGSNVVNK